MRWRRAAVLGLAAAVLLLANARAQSAVAPDDPALIRNMAQLCMRAAPKKRFGRCRALASTPPVKTLPELGTTVL